LALQRANLRYVPRKLPKKKLAGMTNSRWPQWQVGQQEQQAGPTRAVWKAVLELLVAAAAATFYTK